jgi:MarR family 2-MHQ and catechol resistance regulon transcriptional repressor
MKIKNGFEYDQRTQKSMQTWIYLLRSFKMINAKETSFIAKHNLSKNQFEVLEALYHMGDLKIGELTKLIMSTPGNITVVLKNLKREDFIDVLKNDDDKRSFVLSITDKGKNKISSMFDEHSKNLKSCFDEFSDEELETIFIMMRRLYKYNKKG